MARLQDSLQYRGLLRDFYLSSQSVLEILKINSPDQLGLVHPWDEYAWSMLPSMECLAEELNAFYGADIAINPVVTNSRLDAGREYFFLQKRLGDFIEKSPLFQEVPSRLTLHNKNLAKHLDEAEKFVGKYNSGEEDNRSSLWLEGIVQNNAQEIQLHIYRRKEDMLNYIAETRLAEKIAADITHCGIRLDNLEIENIRAALNETCNDSNFENSETIAEEDVARSFFNALQNNCRLNTRIGEVRRLIRRRIPQVSRIIGFCRRSLQPYYELEKKLRRLYSRLPFVLSGDVKRDIMLQKFQENQQPEHYVLSSFEKVRATDLLKEAEKPELQESLRQEFRRADSERNFWRAYGRHNDLNREAQATVHLQRALRAWVFQECRECENLNEIVMHMGDHVSAEENKALDQRMAALSRDIIAIGEAAPLYLGLNLNDSGIHRKNVFCSVDDRFGAETQIRIYRKLHTAFLRSVQRNRQELDNFSGDADWHYLTAVCGNLPPSLQHYNAVHYLLRAGMASFKDNENCLQNFEADCVELLSKTHPENREKLAGYLALGAEQFPGLRRAGVLRLQNEIDAAVIVNYVLPLYYKEKNAKSGRNVFAAVPGYQNLAPEEKKFVSGVLRKYAAEVCSRHRTKLEKGLVDEADIDYLQDLKMQKRRLRQQKDDIMRLKQIFIRQKKSYNRYLEFAEKSARYDADAGLARKLLMENKFSMN